MVSAFWEYLYLASLILFFIRSYKKIAEAFENAGLPMPTVKNDCGGTLVTIMRPTENPYKVQNVGSYVGSVSEVMSVVMHKMARKMSGKKFTVLRTIQSEIDFLQKL